MNKSAIILIKTYFYLPFLSPPTPKREILFSCGVHGEQEASRGVERETLPTRPVTPDA